jgi:GTPase Era involved in 16S rRNA processing
MIQQFDTRQTSILQWANSAHSLCVEEGDATAAVAVAAAIEKYKQDNFTIAILGQAKRGKSTLINALLGRNDDILAPVDKLPATNVATTFSWAEKLSVEVAFRDGTVTTIQPSEIREYVTEEGNPENRKAVGLLRVAGPFPERLRKVTLVDLPGAGSIHDQHDQILLQFLPQSDAVLLLTTARMPINANDIELLGEAQKNDIKKFFVAINKTDATETADLADAEMHNTSQLKNLGLGAIHQHKISAKLALAGEWDKSGFYKLWENIISFIRERREEFRARRLVLETLHAMEPVASSLNVRFAALGKKAEEIEAKRRQFEDEAEELQTTRTLREQEFVVKWKSAMSEVELKLAVVERDVWASVFKRLSETDKFSLNKLEKELPIFITKATEEKLALALQTMNEKLLSLIKDLEESGFSPPASLPVAATAMTAVSAAMPLVTTTTMSALVSTLAGLAPAIGTIIAGGVAATPVGWIIAGIGPIVLATKWLSEKNKQQKSISEQAETYLNKIFKTLREEFFPKLKECAKDIAEHLRLHLERRQIAVSAALREIARNADSPEYIKTVLQQNEKIKQLLNNADIKKIVNTTADVAK